MKQKELIKNVVWFVGLIAVLWGLRAFVFSPVVVSGDSMKPTLVDGERVIALKNVKIKRFDIVTFPAPDEAGRDYIKRVIGLPGDTIEYKNDTLYINGKKYSEPYLNEYKAKLANGAKLTDDFTLENKLNVTKVPEGKLFVLGDNRQISKDSRYIGFISESKILGDVRFSFWPLNKFGTID